MKKTALLILLMMITAGCGRIPVYVKEDKILTTEEFQELPADQQEGWAKEERTVISDKTADIGDKASSGAIMVAPVVETLWPSLAGLVGIVGSVAGIWQNIKRKKLAGILDGVSAGAKATADTIDDVIKPSTELFEKFRKAQSNKVEKALKRGENIIMPDKVVKA